MESEIQRTERNTHEMRFKFWWEYKKDLEEIKQSSDSLRRIAVEQHRKIEALENENRQLKILLDQSSKRKVY